MKHKYLVIPGWVTSKYDGQRHYISATELIRLYNVDPRECRIYEPAPWWTSSIFRYEAEENKGLIELRPRYHGDYSV